MKRRQKLFLTFFSAALLSLGLSACGKSADDIAAASGNTLLSYVPDESPYLAGNLAPIPGDVIDATFRRAQPALDALQAVLADTQISLSGSAAEANPEMAIVAAILEELDGKLNRQGIESLGFTMESYQVVYGLGVFPVLRMSLGDAQALRDTIGRIETNSGIDFPELQHQGQAYWKLTSESANADHDMPAAVYFAIVEEAAGAHLALGALPLAAESELLPALLGQARPASNTAAQRLAEINLAYGYTPHGTGMLDLQRLFDQLVDQNSLLRRMLEDSGANIDERFSEVCRAEFRELIARAPRMVAGTTEMTPAAMGGQYRLEMADDLASDLAALVSSVPPAPAETERLLEFAFGIRIGAARDFLIRKATALSQKNYQCEALEGINKRASEALVNLNRPVPPLVNNFLGFRASLSALPEDESDLEGVRGTVALHVSQPEMFVGMAQMFLPQLTELQLVKGQPPVRLPESLIPVPGLVTHAAMSDTALGIAVGQGEEARLTGFLEEDSKGDGSFLSMNYDMAAYMDKIDQLSENLKSAGLSDDSIMDGEFEGQDSEARREQVIEMAEAIEEAIRNMAGRSYLSLRFDEHGFALDSKVTFKD